MLVSLAIRFVTICGETFELEIHIPSPTFKGFRELLPVESDQIPSNEHSCNRHSSLQGYKRGRYFFWLSFSRTHNILNFSSLVRGLGLRFNFAFCSVGQLVTDFGKVETQLSSLAAMKSASIEDVPEVARSRMNKLFNDAQLASVYHNPRT